MKMKKLLALLTALAVIITLAACSETPDSLYKKGNKLLKAKDWDGAIECFEQMIELDDSDERGYVGAAKAYEGMDKLEKAVKILKKGLKKADDTDDIEDYLDEHMNSLARDIRDCVTEWITDMDTKGFSVNRSYNGTVEADAVGDGVFSVLTSTDSLFLNPYLPTGMQLNDFLSAEFPNMKPSHIVANFMNGAVVSLLYYPEGSVPDVYWDSSQNEWIAEGAQSDGVDKNGVVFGTWPAHHVNY